jgi:hypothetical protein
MFGISIIQTINEPPVGELPQLGLRVWVPEGLRYYGLNKACISPHTGGTIVYEDRTCTNYAVKWDDGQTTMHNAFDFAKGLICTGTCQTLSDYFMLYSERQS